MTHTIFEKTDQLIEMVKTRKPALFYAVIAYRNEDVVERLQRKMNLGREEADVLFTDLLKFLALCGVRRLHATEYSLVPPKNIDEAWHHFLLFTREYADFCMEFFGAFIHHQPSTSRTQLRGNRIPDAIALAEDVFGSVSSNWSSHWLESAEECGGSTNCQVCYK